MPDLYPSSLRLDPWANEAPPRSPCRCAAADEYEAVVTRPKHLNAAGLTAAEVGILLDAVATVAERMRLAFL